MVGNESSEPNTERMWRDDEDTGDKQSAKVACLLRHSSLGRGVLRRSSRVERRTKLPDGSEAKGMPTPRTDGSAGLEAS